MISNGSFSPLRASGASMTRKRGTPVVCVVRGHTVTEA